MRNNKGYYDWRTRRFIPSNKPSRTEINAYIGMLEEIGKIKVSRYETTERKPEEPRAEKDGQLCLF